MDPTEFDYRVFEITSEISKQVFPMTLDTDNPKFRAGMERLLELSERAEELYARGGLLNKLGVSGVMAQSGIVFARLYLLPTRPNNLPEQVCTSPALR